MIITPVFAEVSFTFKEIFKLLPKHLMNSVSFICFGLLLSSNSRTQIMLAERKQLRNLRKASIWQKQHVQGSQIRWWRNLWRNFRSKWRKFCMHLNSVCVCLWAGRSTSIKEKLVDIQAFHMLGKFKYSILIRYICYI